MSEVPTDDERPPVFTSWRGWYWLVITVLLVQIVAYTWISNSFK
jgi:hypothetical protein